MANSLWKHISAVQQYSITLNLSFSSGILIYILKLFTFAINNEQLQLCEHIGRKTQTSETQKIISLKSLWKRLFDTNANYTPLNYIIVELNLMLFTIPIRLKSVVVKSSVTSPIKKEILYSGILKIRVIKSQTPETSTSIKTCGR